MSTHRKTAISILMDELDIQIEYDRRSYALWLKNRRRKIARAERRERDLEDNRTAWAKKVEEVKE